MTAAGQQPQALNQPNVMGPRPQSELLTNTLIHLKLLKYVRFTKCYSARLVIVYLSFFLQMDLCLCPMCQIRSWIACRCHKVLAQLGNMLLCLCYTSYTAVENLFILTFGWNLAPIDFMWNSRLGALKSTDCGTQPYERVTHESSVCVMRCY